ncbi:MAG: TRZ/ATZ family hydrolase [Ectothiorhodospiraceae bacterium]|nr:TRZ/ATZ family hydrolase [Ectothiorhodospiraceae bacterium]
MEPVDQLVNARWVIPVEPRDVVLEAHAVAIDGERIVAVLPQREAAARFAPRATVDLDHHALIPGLVNAHTHAAMSLFRGLADDLPLERWLHEHVWPAEARHVSDGFVRDGTRLAVAEMLRGGTTCFNDMYFYPDECARVAAEAGIRAVVGLIVVDFPTVWAGDADEYIAKALDVHDRLRDLPLVTTAFAPHAPYTVSDRPLERVRTLADELELPVHMHVHETADEVARAIEATGCSGLDRLERLGLLSDRLVAVHMTQLTELDIERLATHAVHVVHCPESNLKLASGFCPVARLVDAGVNVAIGTDGAASNNDLSMLGELRTASLLAKGVAGDASAFPAWQALHAATLGGARALGLDEIIGSLRPGKQADLAAIDLAAIETSPVYHPLSDLVYAASAAQVTDVWVAGRRLLAARELLTLDVAEIAETARRWRPRIAEHA